MKTLLSAPVEGSIQEQLFKSTITWRNGSFITDEPESLGGQDLGPDPYTLLLASLLSCTLATLRMYINRKGYPINTIHIEGNLSQRIVNQQIITTITRSIHFEDSLEPEIQKRLLDIAKHCPISKIITGQVDIETEIV